MSVNCEVEAKCLSVITVWQEQMRAGAASLRQSGIICLSIHLPPLCFLSTDHPRLPEAAWIHPITSNDDWYPWQLIISIIRWFPVGVISPLSLHVHLCEPLNTLSRSVWSNFSVRPEESGPRHCLGTRGGWVGVVVRGVKNMLLVGFVIKANQIQPTNVDVTPRECITPHARHDTHARTH